MKALAELHRDSEEKPDRARKAIIRPVSTAFAMRPTSSETSSELLTVVCSS